MLVQLQSSAAHLRRRLLLLILSLALLGGLSYLLADRRAIFAQASNLGPFKSSSAQSYSVKDAPASSNGLERADNVAGCPTRLSALYGTDRFSSVPWQEDAANITFPAGHPVEDAHLCNPALSTEKVAVIVEMLEDENLVPHILRFIERLGNDWPVVLYHSKMNEDSILVNGALRPYLLSGKVQRVRLNTAFLSHYSVSQFLAHAPFYEHLIPAKYILLFQTDSTLCSNATQSVESFFRYDYIGSPIHSSLFDEPIPRFNGGLSLRNREAMLQVIQDSAPFEDPGQPWIWEDQWFSMEMAKSNVNYSLPTIEEASTFAVESVFNAAPLGVHRPHMFIPMIDGYEQYQKLLDFCPEIEEMTTHFGPTVFDPCKNDPDSHECALSKFTAALESQTALKTCETEPERETCREAKARQAQEQEPHHAIGKPLSIKRSLSKSVAGTSQ